MSAVRVQRSRAKGWRMPDNTVYVGRGTKWGNPHKVGYSLARNDDGTYRYMTVADAMEAFRETIKFGDYAFDKALPFVPPFYVTGR